MRNRRSIVIGLVVGVLLLIAAPAYAAAPYANGTYTTPTQQGTIRFTPARAVAQIGYEGKFVINGKTYPGTLYTIRGTSNTGMVWYYGVSGIQAGTAIVSPAGGTAYTGTITFTNRQGQITDAGTLSVVIALK